MISYSRKYNEVLERDGNIYHPQNIIRTRTGRAYYFLKKIVLEYGDNSYKVVAYLINAKTGKNEIKQPLSKTDLFSERYKIINFNDIISEPAKKQIQTQVNNYNRSKPVDGFFKTTEHKNREDKPYYILTLKNPNRELFYKSALDGLVEQLFDDGEKMKNNYTTNIHKTNMGEGIYGSFAGNTWIPDKLISNTVLAGTSNLSNQFLTYDGMSHNVWLDVNPNELIVNKKKRKKPNKMVILEEDSLIIDGEEIVFESEGVYGEGGLINYIAPDNNNFIYYDMYNGMKKLEINCLGIPKEYLGVDDSIGIGGAGGSVSLIDKGFPIVNTKDRERKINNKIIL